MLLFFSSVWLPLLALPCEELLLEEVPVASLAVGGAEGPAVSLTMRLNVSLMEAPAGSVAVMRTGRVEASASAGVPEKLRERGSKVSQAGRGAPEAVPSSIRAV